MTDIVSLTIITLASAPVHCSHKKMSAGSLC